MHNSLYRIPSWQAYFLIGLLHVAFSWVFCNFSHAALFSFLLDFSYDLTLNFLVTFKSLNLLFSRLLIPKL